MDSLVIPVGIANVVLCLETIPPSFAESRFSSAAHIAKVECRSKACFDCAETQAFICAKHKYSESREQRQIYFGYAIFLMSRARNGPFWARYVLETAGCAQKPLFWVRTTFMLKVIADFL